MGLSSMWMNNIGSGRESTSHTPVPSTTDLQPQQTQLFWLAFREEHFRCVPLEPQKLQRMISNFLEEEEFRAAVQFNNFTYTEHSIMGTNGK